MFRAETASEIAPYLEAEYWGGKMIGEERLLSLPVLERKPLGQLAMAARGIKLSPLERVASGGATLKAKSIYQTGEIFSPDDHEPGLIVSYRKEVLVKDPETLDEDVDPSDEIALPFGLKFSTAPSIPDYNHSIQRLAEPPFTYYLGERLGLIIPASDKNHPNELIYLSGLSGIMRGDGRGLGLPRVNVEETPFSVGQARRYTTKRGAELLIRVNALEVYGIVDKPKRKRIKTEKTDKKDPFAEFFLPNQPVTP